MNTTRHALLAALCVAAYSPAALANGDTTPRRIVLVAGDVARVDTLGHHDYLAGCLALDVLLRQTSGVTTARVDHGWPSDESVLDGAAAVVFYTDGGGKQAFLATPDRVARMQTLADAGVGFVLIHQAVDFPDEFATQGLNWIGGVYLKAHSGRGHWPSLHVDFPAHPITRGVTAWQAKDGWLNGLKFADNMQGITPLVWSGKEFEESRAGIDRDIVGWAFERPGGGRSFSFTGLDGHLEWERPGVRQLLVNGVLWSAGADIPDAGAPCRIDKPQLDALQTPREPKSVPAGKPAAKPAAVPQ